MEREKEHSDKSHQANGNSHDAAAANVNPEKTLKCLEELAKSTYMLLVNIEHQWTEHLWALGDYLTDIRRQLGLAHGAWMKYLEVSLHIEYRRAKCACRLRKLYEKSGDCKGMTLELALRHKPSPNVKAAKQAQAKVKCCGRNSGGGNPFLPGPQQMPPTDEEKEALKIYLDACGTVERALFVLETVMPHA